MPGGTTRETQGKREGAQSPEPRSHFLPFRKSDLVGMALAEGGLPEGDHKGFRELAEILSALFHYEYHRNLEDLKDLFAAPEPASGTRPAGIAPPSGRGERDERERRFVAELEKVLVGGNFLRMTREEIRRSINADPGLKMRLEVDLDCFAELAVFRRDRLSEEIVEKRFFGLRKERVERAYYDRVVLYGRFKEADRFAPKARSKLSFQPGRAFLKLFDHVPADGLEMLFPNAKMRMRTFDKLVLGVPAAAGGIAVLATKLAATLALVFALLAFYLRLNDRKVELSQGHLVALGLGLFALAGHTFKQLSKFRSRQTKYLKDLSDRLYFTVLDNNEGVLHHVIGSAEDEDTKEALLAYYFLLTRARAKDRRMSEGELDHEIEKWFASSHGAEVDFEADDALAKLDRLGLAERDGEARWTAKTLDEAKTHIDRLWDNFFTYNEA